MTLEIKSIDIQEKDENKILSVTVTGVTVCIRAKNYDPNAGSSII